MSESKYTPHPFYNNILISKREEWRSVKGWESSHQVSNQGRVKSLGRSSVQKNPHGIGYRTYQVKEKILQPTISNNGYSMVGLFYSGLKKSKRVAVHRLVLEAFVGPCPEGMECRHFPDRDKTNNRLENLQWGTNAEQIEDRKEHGTIRYGEGIGNAKLTERKVLEIRRLHRPGEYGALVGLARRFGVSTTTIQNIVHRKHWKHL